MSEVPLREGRGRESRERQREGKRERGRVREGERGREGERHREREARLSHLGKRCSQAPTHVHVDFVRGNTPPPPF